MVQSILLTTTIIVLCMGICLTAEMPLHEMQKKSSTSFSQNETHESSSCLDDFLTAFENLNLTNNSDTSNTAYYVCHLTTLYQLSESMVSIVTMYCFLYKYNTAYPSLQSLNSTCEEKQSLTTVAARLKNIQLIFSPASSVSCYASLFSFH